MNFLDTELRDLPPAMKQALLSQLETVLREMNQKFKPFSALGDLQSTALCAKVHAILDLAGRFRKNLKADDDM